MEPKKPESRRRSHRNRCVVNSGKGDRHNQVDRAEDVEKLPRVINDYVRASNEHDVQSILACFSNNAVVHDEGEKLHGKKAIELWIAKTIEKYKFQFKPLSVRDNDAEVVVAMEVSGRFDGSPITLDYHFSIESDKILSLTID